MSVKVFRKTDNNNSAEPPSGVSYLDINSYENLLVQIQPNSTSTDLCFGLDDSLLDLLKSDATNYDAQKIAIVKSALDNLAISQTKVLIGNLQGCNVEPIPKGSGFTSPPSYTVVTINCQLVAKLIEKDPTLTITKLQQWLNQIRVLSNNLLKLSTLNNPPAFIEPEATPSGSDIKNYRLLAPTAQELRLEFDLAVSGTSRLLSNITLADDNAFATISGNKLIVPVSQTNIKPGENAPITLFTNEPALATNNKRTVLNFNVNYIDSLELVDSVSLRPITEDLYPGIQNKRIVPLLKLVDGETYNLSSSSDRTRLGNLVKIPSPLFSFSTAGSFLQVDADGYLTVPSNSILPTGPFTKTFRVEGPDHAFVVEESLTVDMDTLVVSTPSGVAILGKDYFIVDVYPLKIKAPTPLLIKAPYDLTVSYQVIRTLAQYISAGESQSVKLDLNFRYAGWQPSTSTVIKIKPPTGWYKVFDGLGASGIDGSQLLNTLGTFTGVLTNLSTGVRAFLKVTETLKSFVPIFGLFELTQLPNILSILLGPVSEQLTNVLDTGVYWTYFVPSDFSEQLQSNPPGPTASTTIAPGENGGTNRATQAGGQAQSAPPETEPKIYSSGDIVGFNKWLQYLSDNSYWIEPIRGGYALSIFLNTIAETATKSSPSNNTEHFRQLAFLFRAEGLGIYKKSTPSVTQSTTGGAPTSPRTNSEATTAQSVDFIVSKVAKATKGSTGKPQGKKTTVPPVPAKSNAASAATTVQGNPKYLVKSAQPPNLNSDALNDYNAKLKSVYDSIDVSIDVKSKSKVDRYYWVEQKPEIDPTASAFLMKNPQFNFDLKKRNALLQGPTQ